jgi:hypothetical protein
MLLKKLILDLILSGAGVEVFNCLIDVSKLFKEYLIIYYSYIMNDTDKLQHIKTKAVERQKRYYDAHKQKILDKKKADRDQLKIINTPIPEVIIPKEFSLTQIIEILTANITAENTRKKYINDVKRIFSLAKLDKFAGTIEEHNTIKTIESSKYSLSTQRGSIQSVLVFIDLSKIVIDAKVKARYALLLDVAKVKTVDQQEERQADTANSVIPYDEYLLLIYDKFEENSKERLIASLYNEIPVRDNFGSLRIIESFEEDDGVGNFLLRSCEHIILNNYKTKNVYDKIVYDLSAELGVLLTKYIEACEVTE